ncbi:hypothetical protein CJU89_3225 [Yarrowia sp. B02]|nr:hypothetical protein CJU89_3225 [Yarrowia sp. B02]
MVNHNNDLIQFEKNSKTESDSFIESDDWMTMTPSQLEEYDKIDLINFLQQAAEDKRKQTAEESQVENVRSPMPKKRFTIFEFSIWLS